MKRVLFLSILLCLLISPHLKAQINFYTEMYPEATRVFTSSKEYREKLTKAEVKEVLTYKADKKGEKYLLNKAEHDEQGFLTVSMRYNPKGAEVGSIVQKHDEEGRLVSYESYKGNGNLGTKIEYIYSPTGKMTQNRLYYGKSVKLSSLTDIEYNDADLMAEKNQFQGPKKKLRSRYTYEYYENGQKKRTSHYNRKGKEVRSWTFSCTPEGEVEKKATNVCVKWDQKEDGTKIKTVENTHPKSKVTRWVYTYDAKDKLIEAIAYNKRTRRISHWRSVYNEKGQMVEYITYARKSDKEAMHGYYTFNDQNLVVENIMKDGKGKVISHRWMEYK